MKKIIVSPSILNADFNRLGEECLSLQNSGANWLHCDVMDGVFVPNISFGLPVVKDLNKLVNIPLDVHLMIENPLLYVEQFVDAGAKIVTFHYESTSDVAATAKAIRNNGALVGVSVKPATDVRQLLPFADLLDMILVMSVEPGFGGQKFLTAALDKIRLARQLFPQKLIQVDGGINAETAKLCLDAGADVLVAGNYIISAPDRAAAISKLKNL